MSRDSNREEAYRIMSSNGFSYEKRREWVIWGARHQACTECKQDSYQPCMNLSDIRRAESGWRGVIRLTRNPHDQRIDWSRVIRGLYQRGYK